MRTVAGKDYWQYHARLGENPMHSLSVDAVTRFVEAILVALDGEEDLHDLAEVRTEVWRDGLAAYVDQLFAVPPLSAAREAIEDEEWETLRQGVALQWAGHGPFYFPILREPTRRRFLCWLAAAGLALLDSSAEDSG